MHHAPRTATTTAVLALALAGSLLVPASAAVAATDAVAKVDARSEFYAGFAATGVGDATTGATFRVPDLTCGDTDEGYVTTVYAISEDGEFLAGADLFSYCSGGDFVLDGHITTSGGQIPIWQELQPGDEVRLTISKRAEGPSTHDVAFASLTRGWTSTLPTNSPVERIEIAQRRMSLEGERLLPPDYGRALFTDVVFDDVPLADAGAKRTKLVAEDGSVLIGAKRLGEDRFRLVSRVG